jgi:adenosylhomocysteine nucleosidase
LAHIGILTALLPEAAALARKPEVNTLITLSEQTTLFVCGVGAERARRGAERLLANGAQALIGMGMAGALAGHVRSGDVIIPDRILDAGGRHHETDAGWRATVISAISRRGFPVHGGSLLHSAHIVRRARDKHDLHRATGALAVDMESAAMLEVATGNNIPSLVLRVIIDTADMVIPDFIIAQSDDYGRPRSGGVILSLLKQPGQLPHLVRLARGYRVAAGRLRRLGEDLDVLTPAT